MKTTKPADDIDVNERKNINKLTDQLTSEALESKSVLEFNGKEVDVKQNAEEQEHANFLSYNKQAVHDAYLDMRKELGLKSNTEESKPEEMPEKKVVKKVMHDQNLSEQKSDEKEEAESDSESNSESESEDDDKKKKKKKEKGKKKKSKKGKKEKKKKSKSVTSKTQVNQTAAANATQPVKNVTQPAATLVQKESNQTTIANATTAVN